MPEGGSLTPIIAVSAQGFSITHKPVESFDYKCRNMTVYSNQWSSVTLRLKAFEDLKK
jgi:hypothetical protein